MILLTLCLFSFSVFASFKGGKLLPTLFDQGVDEESFIVTSAQISTYQQQIQELTTQREQLTNGDLGYRYGWKQKDAQNFSLNESGQRKLEDIDAQLKLLREKLIELNEYAQKIHQNGWYLATLSLLMEILIVISGAWLVWYGVNVEVSLSAQMRKEDFPAQMDLFTFPDGEQNETIQMEIEKPMQLNIAQLVQSEAPLNEAQILKEVIRKVYFKLKNDGVRSTWRNVLNTLPEEEHQWVNEYKVRRILTKIRRAEKDIIKKIH